MVKDVKTIKDFTPDDILEHEAFYVLAQEYRHSLLADQPGVTRAFEALKRFIREHKDEIK